MRRPQFNLRIIFLFVTLFAAAFGVYSIFKIDPPRPISIEQGKTIKVGMTQWQVKRLLGEPHQKANDRWAFDYIPSVDHGDAYLEVVFDAKGTAIKIQKGSYVSYLYSDTAPPSN